MTPHPGNNNVHPSDQIEALAAILAYQGFTRPIGVSTRTGFMTKGHALLEASKKIGLKFVPVDLLDYEDEEHELADLLADNALAKRALPNAYKTADILKELDNGSFKMEMTGYSNSDLERYFVGKTWMPSIPTNGDMKGFDTSIPDGYEMPQPKIDSKDEVKEKAEKKPKHKCPECGHEY